VEVLAGLLIIIYNDTVGLYFEFFGSNYMILHILQITHMLMTDKATDTWKSSSHYTTPPYWP